MNQEETLNQILALVIERERESGENEAHIKSECEMAARAFKAGLAAFNLVSPPSSEVLSTGPQEVSSSTEHPQ